MIRRLVGNSGADYFSLFLGPDREGSSLHAVGDRIVFFGLGVPEPADDALRVECADCVIEPGRVNAHTHIYSALAPLGMPAPHPPPENFLEILGRVWWRLDRALDRESLRACARLYAAEALLAGTTSLIDHHESPGFIEGSLDVIADACEEIGVRALLCYGATERNGGRAEARRGLAECRRFIAANRRPLLRGVAGLHASFTVSDDTIREAGDLCRELGAALHIHLAEDAADVGDARERGYAGPLERLLTLDGLPEGSIAAHGVHLDGDQVRRLAAAGAWLVQNPRSNRGNRVGYPGALRESDRVALGTDGYVANMEDEEAMLLEEAQAHGDDVDAARRRPGAGRALAAEAFGIPFAPLAAGAAADAVARSGEGVRHVVVAGRLIVRDGRLLTADLEEIRRQAREQAPRLWQRMAATGDTEKGDRYL